MAATNINPGHLSTAANTGPTPQPAANRLQGADDHDFTSHMPSQVSWTIDNMPDILYQWKPTAANISTGEVGLKPYLIFDKVLRNFDVLPDRISSNVEPWLLQAWFRLDSRIRWEDITDRVEPRARPKWNTINMDCVRQREDFFMRPWSTSKGVSTRTRDAAFEKLLRNAGVDPARNTTRGLTPGLIDPNAGPNSARVPVPEKWTKPRKQRKAEVDTFVAVRETRDKAISSIPLRKSGGRVSRAKCKEGKGGRGGPDERNARDHQTLSVDKAEGSSEKQSRKRKASAIETVLVNDDSTSKRRNTGMTKWPKLGEKTSRKRKAPQSGETEQREQERPRKLRDFRPKAVRQFEVEKETENLDSGLYPEGSSAKGREHYELHLQSLPSASGQLRKRGTAASSRALALSKGQQAADTLGVGASRAYIGYLQTPAAEIEAKGIQVEIMRQEPPNRFACNTSRDASLIQSPVIGTLHLHAYTDTETELSADLSLPSAVMTPRDLGEDMISSGHSTQSDLFGNCMGDDLEDFLQRTFCSMGA